MTAISVIIPSFCPSGFDALEQSINTNTNVDAEWIVIDDGSGSEYQAVFAALPSGVRLISQSKNRGQGAARNLGLAAAGGKWIKFLDADDKLDEGHLAALLDAANGALDGAIVFAPTKHVFPNGSISINDSWRDLPKESMPQYCRQLVRPFLHHCGALYPRDLLIQMGGYDERLITDEDGDLLLRILHAGYHFTPVEGAYYLYTHHESGMRVSYDFGISKMQARVLTCDKVEAAFDWQMPAPVAEALAQRMDKIAFSYWVQYPDEARALLIRASKLSPGYRPDMRAPLRLLRWVGGPSLVLAATSLHRSLMGRPRGGAKG